MNKIWQIEKERKMSDGRRMEVKEKEKAERKVRRSIPGTTRGGERKGMSD